MPWHGKLKDTDIHRPVRWVVADQAAREAITINPDGSSITDDDGLYCVCLQLDNKSLWVVTATSPLTFEQVGSGGETEGTFNFCDDFFAVENMSIYKNTVLVSSSITIDACGVGKHYGCKGDTAQYTITLPTTGVAVGDIIAFSGAGDMYYPVTLDAGTGVLIGKAQTTYLFFDQQLLLKWDGSNWEILFNEHKLKADKTINIATTLPNADLHAIINALPKNLNGASITFQLADGTYTGKTFPFSDFVAGNITVQGNTSESGLHTNQAVIIDNSGITAEEDKAVIDFNNCSVHCTVQYIKCVVPDVKYAVSVSATGVHNIYIYSCYFSGVSSPSNTTIGALFIYTVGVCEETYFGNTTRGLLSAFESHINSVHNDDSGELDYALMVTWGGVIQKYDATQPSGTIDEETWNGVIRG